MAKITVTVEDDTKLPEELTAIATKAIQEALNPPKTKPIPDKDGYCKCGDHTTFCNLCKNCGGWRY